MFSPGRGEQGALAWGSSTLGVGDLQRYSNIGSPILLNFIYSCSAHFQLLCIHDPFSKDSPHSPSCLVVVLQACCFWPNHGWWYLLYDTVYAMRVHLCEGSLLAICKGVTCVLKTLRALRLGPWFIFWGTTSWFTVIFLLLLSLGFLFPRPVTHWSTIFFSFFSPIPSLLAGWGGGEGEQRTPSEISKVFFFSTNNHGGDIVIIIFLKNNY